MKFLAVRIPFLINYDTFFDYGPFIRKRKCDKIDDLRIFEF